MDYTFSELLSEVPNEIFFDDKGDPNFNAIFVEVARRIYRQEGTSFSIPTEDFLAGKLPNLSSFHCSTATSVRSIHTRRWPTKMCDYKTGQSDTDLAEY